MQAHDFIDVIKSTIKMISTISFPFLISVLAIGLIIGILQAASQIQEMTIAFLPKLMLVSFLLFYYGPSLSYKFNAYISSLFEMIIKVGLS
jgi:flagellar biosynthetic protein FliQ